MNTPHRHTHTPPIHSLGICPYIKRYKKSNAPLSLSPIPPCPPPPPHPRATVGRPAPPRPPPPSPPPSRHPPPFPRPSYPSHPAPRVLPTSPEHSTHTSVSYGPLAVAHPPHFLPFTYQGTLIPPWFCSVSSCFEKNKSRFIGSSGLRCRRLSSQLIFSLRLCFWHCGFCFRCRLRLLHFNQAAGLRCLNLLFNVEVFGENVAVG